MDTDNRNQALDAELQQLVTRTAQRVGTKRTAAALGISREALLGVISGLPVRAGTLALIRERSDCLVGLTSKTKDGGTP